jgi:hypothetical protein
LEPKTNADGITRTRSQFGVNDIGGYSIRHERSQLPEMGRWATWLHLKDARAKRFRLTRRQYLSQMMIGSTQRRRWGRPTASPRGDLKTRAGNLLMT